MFFEASAFFVSTVLCKAERIRRCQRIKKQRKEKAITTLTAPAIAHLTVCITATNTGMLTQSAWLHSSLRSERTYPKSGRFSWMKPTMSKIGMTSIRANCEIRCKKKSWMNIRQIRKVKMLLILGRRSQEKATVRKKHCFLSLSRRIHRKHRFEKSLKRAARNRSRISILTILEWLSSLKKCVKRKRQKQANCRQRRR